MGRVNLVDKTRGLGLAAINVTSIRDTDAGWYQCQILFPNRTPNTRGNGSWFHLNVDGGALMKIPPINMTVMEGESAHFNCVVKHPATSIVTWFKDGVELQQMNGLVDRCTQLQDGSLRIERTQMEDLGEYRCEIRNNGETQSSQAFLNVQCKNRIWNLEFTKRKSFITVSFNSR